LKLAIVFALIGVCTTLSMHSVCVCVCVCVCVQSSNEQNYKFYDSFNKGYFNVSLDSAKAVLKAHDFSTQFEHIIWGIQVDDSTHWCRINVV
jgi:hypothetical protein